MNTCDPKAASILLTTQDYKKRRISLRSKLTPAYASKTSSPVTMPSKSSQKAEKDSKESKE
jgi:hypothetical protein